jgi:hypothetical protein
MLRTMRARLLLNERHQIRSDAFVALRVWQVPRLVSGSAHDNKYALAHIVAGMCVLRYDNEAGKGDHRHIGAVETPYDFTTSEQRLADFWDDVDRWRPS